MKILKWVVIVLVVLVAVFVVGGLLLPNTFEVTRSATMNAPMDKVHGVIGDLNQWPKWGSWWRNYPDMKNTFSGDGVSVGSKLSWTGDEAGNGTIEVAKTDPAGGFFTTVSFHTEGDDDIKFNSDLLYSADGSGTKVTWKSHGDLGGNLIWKWMGALFMDSMMAKDYEDGLKNAKEIIEAAPKP